MERFYVIAPALIPAAYMIAMFAYFCLCSALGRQPLVDGVNRRKFSEIIGPFLTSYFLWLLRPLERSLVASRISPNALTGGSLLACAGAGAAIATGHLATAAWAYVAAGMLDVLDGRLARATGRSSRAGAFLDSISDRWGELFVFAGFAWFLRESAWLGAVMLAVAGSVMVSYTRARGEGLGLALDGGTMQRAERILVVTLGTFAGAWVHAAESTAAYTPHIMGVALLLMGVGSAATSIGRWIEGYKILLARGERPAAVEPRAVPRASRDLARSDSSAA